MITLSLLKFLEDNNFGEINKDLFFGKLALDKKGLYIVDIGASNERGQQRSQTYEIYSRGKSDVDGYKKLQSVIDFLNDSYEICNLPAVPLVSDKQYDNVTIMPPSSISNIGQDANGRMIYSTTGTIYY